MEVDQVKYPQLIASSTFPLLSNKAMDPPSSGSQKLTVCVVPKHILVVELTRISIAEAGGGGAFVRLTIAKPNGGIIVPDGIENETGILLLADPRIKLDTSIASQGFGLYNSIHSPCLVMSAVAPTNP